MAFDGNGNYTVPPGTPGITGELISSTSYNAFLTDLQTALSNVLTRDGQSAATSNISLGGFRLTNLAAASSATDGVRFDQLGTVAAAPVLGGLTLANFTLTNTTPNGRVEISSTNPLGWNTGPGKMTVDYEFNSTAYFAQNPDGHHATILRQDPATFATQLTGNGVIMGNLMWTGFNGDEALFGPTTMLETWDPIKTIPTQRYIFPKTTGPRNKLLADGVAYRMIVESTVAENLVRYMRYRLYRYSGATKNAWDLEVDSGTVLDHNPGADFTKSGLMFGRSLDVPLGGAWSIAYSNVKIVWGPAGSTASDKSDTLSAYGADFEGDATFLQAAARIRAPYNAGPSLVNSLTMQSSTANTATTLVLKPNGSATQSNMLFSDNSTSSTVYRVFEIGINGATASLKTYNLGSTDAAIEIAPGGVARIRFDANGTTLQGSSTPINTAIPYHAGVSNIGGANATAFGASAFDIESLCTVGTIAAYLGATPSSSGIEEVLRPLYCMFSSLWGHDRAKKLK